MSETCARVLIWTFIAIVIYVDDSILANVEFEELRADIRFAKEVYTKLGLMVADDKEDMRAPENWTVPVLGVNFVRNEMAITLSPVWSQVVKLNFAAKDALRDLQAGVIEMHALQTIMGRVNFIASCIFAPLTLFYTMLAPWCGERYFKDNIRPR